MRVTAKMRLAFLACMLTQCGATLNIPFLGQIPMQPHRQDDPQTTMPSVEDTAALSKGAPGKQPNILFVLVDDQDLLMESYRYMPILQRELAEKGVTYMNHFTTTALCCPARVSLWTGRMAHNTNVTDVNTPHGGYPKFISQGLNDHYLPVWLQDAGYNTYYTGKLFNAHGIENYNDPAPAGWNNTDFLLDPGTYSYMNPIYQKQGQHPVYHENHHTMELLIGKAGDLLDQALADDRPFFVGVAPPAPHSNIASNLGLRPSNMTAPVPMKQHEHLFPDATIPRTENFNPDTPSGVSWIRHLPQQNESAVAYLDHFYRNRLRALQSVELLLEDLIGRLSAAGRLDDTYIIYTSDNGYHIGQHRLPPGKECGFEEDIRVPMFVRGPGLQAGAVAREVTTHVDLAPTLFQMAGIDLREEFDGTPIPLPGEGADALSQDSRVGYEHVTVEYWGIAVVEGEHADFGYYEPNPRQRSNNTYKAIRVLSDEYNLYYSVWCNNERELYDLRTDPGQLHNLYFDANTGQDIPHPQLLGLDASLVIGRLDSLLMVGKSCKGKTCVQPWKVLHPDGDVQSLRDALDSRFDAFYHDQVSVSFDRCEAGYLISAEGPQDVKAYRDGLAWHAWT